MADGVFMGLCRASYLSPVNENNSLKLTHLVFVSQGLQVCPCVNVAAAAAAAQMETSA